MYVYVDSLLDPTSQLPFLFFFFNDTATTEIYTFPYTTLFRSLEAGGDMVTIDSESGMTEGTTTRLGAVCLAAVGDRKSTRLNSSHMSISYAVFCLKKKKK